MSASTNYLLAEHDDEKRRLDLQYAAVQHTLGGKLIMAPVTIQPGDQILESAAGTGRWMLDLSSQMPENVHITGIDITSRLYPPSHPSNTTFLTHNVLSLPSEWTSKFKYVHQRFLVAALTESVWKQAIAELYRVLVPGGWVELNEAAPGVQRERGPYSARLTELALCVWSSKGLLTDPEAQLPPLLREAGFVDVGIQQCHTRMGKAAGEHGIAMVENIKSASIGMKSHFRGPKGDWFGLVNSEEECDELIQAAAKEWMDGEGASAEVPYKIICARKPVVA